MKRCFLTAIKLIKLTANSKILSLILKNTQEKILILKTYTIFYDLRTQKTLIKLFYPILWDGPFQLQYLMVYWTTIL